MLTFLRPRRQTACAAILPLAPVVCACGARNQLSSSTSAKRSAAAALGVISDNALVARREASTASRRGLTELPTIPPGNVLKTLRGKGNAAIGSRSEGVPVVVEWRSIHAVQRFTDRGLVLPSSRSPRGRIRLAAGRYGGLRVATAGPWRIALRSSR